MTPKKFCSQLFKVKLSAAIAMVDRTEYNDTHVPDLAVRQVFGRQRVKSELCKLAADAGLLTVETFAMLGDDIAAVKATLKAMIPEAASLGTDVPEQELALTSLAAVWKTCSTMQDHFATRRAKMEEDPSKVPEIPGEDHAEFREVFVSRHPDVLLPMHREPHRKFVERVQRDFLVHGFVHFYEVGEIRTRNEQIAQKTGLTKNAEDLLRVVMVDQPSAASSESQVMDKLHAFFITLEYLNICEFSVKAGPLKYLSELEEWRQENRGLAPLLTVDTLIRKKVHRVSSDQRKQFSTFSKALLEVLTNHKQLWNDARSSAELDKFKQAAHTAEPITPKKRSRSSSADAPPRSPRRTKLGGSARRPSSRRQRRCSTILPSKGASQVPLAPPKMSGYPRRSGRQSPPSSTQALAAVLSSIAYWAADSVINASSSTLALNVARIILGTATTDALMGIPRWLPRHHLGIGSARPVARMMLMRPRRLGRQCLH